MTDRYFTLRQTAHRASMCERTLRKYLPEIPHHRIGRKILILWSNFVKWMDSRKVEIQRDDVVMGILREMRGRVA